MPRRASSYRPTTMLGEALAIRRGAETQEQASKDTSVSQSTLSAIERGAHRPSYDTAVKIASWLGWTVEEVMKASVTPA